MGRTKSVFTNEFGDKAKKCEEVRRLAAEFSEKIGQLLPETREKKLALDGIEITVIFANTAIARGE